MQREGVYIEKAGYWEKFEVWLKKNVVGGMIRAVMFIGALSSGIEAIEKYAPIVYANGCQFSVYASHFADYTTDSAKGFLAHMPKPPTPEDKQRQDLVIFSTGTLVYPLSGQWRPG